jgi:penicillin-binding protein 2
MIQPPEDRIPAITPQLALRVAIVGSCALAMFAIIFFRLWFLQVLTGSQYLAQAQTNFVRNIAISPQRGQILDRNGQLMVDSVPAPSIEISAPDLPVPITTADLVRQPGRDLRLYKRLEQVLSIPPAPRRCHVDGFGYQRMGPVACAVAQGVANLPYANVTVAQDVSKYVQYYILERQTQFPGVVVQTAYLRHYPLHSAAAQLFGTIGPINPAESQQKRYKGVSPQAIVGQSGLEYQYDQYLRGVAGEEKVRVNSLGQFQGYGAPTQPISGKDLKLAIDLKLQMAGEAALKESIAANYPASGGAFVALDPRDGEVLAMGSNPTFDPNVFTRPISVARYNELFGPSAGAPQFNRAIAGAGPTGSTFKMVTSMAALQSGAWSPGEPFDDTGQYCVGPGFCLHNAGHAVFGVVDLINAIRVSSDDFFYHLGQLMNVTPWNHPQGGALQSWARGFGIGRRTGVDLPGESSGTLPTPAWRAQRNQLEAECDNATGPFRYTNGKAISAVRHAGFHPSPKHPPGGCGIADGSNRPWSVGDNVNLAVGQGDVQVTPLQLAVAYAALENGGAVVRPHVGLDIQASDGTVLQRIDPPPVRRLHFNPDYRQTVLDGLHAATSQAGGTSYDVMHDFPLPVYGKTGTAQYTGKQDYAWYACFVPSTATSRPIVIIVTVEQGGFGDVAAAPVARQMLNQWFLGKRGTFTAGSSATL